MARAKPCAFFSGIRATMNHDSSYESYPGHKKTFQYLEGLFFVRYNKWRGEGYCPLFVAVTPYVSESYKVLLLQNSEAVLLA